MQRSSCRRIVPTIPARIAPRSHSRAALKIVEPRPSRPRMLSAGSTQFSKTSSPIGAVRNPRFSIVPATLKSGVSRSTRNAVIPSTPLEGSVLAKQTTRSAIARAGDPGLAAVQDPAVAVPLGARLHGEDIRSGFGLAGGVGPEQAAVAETGQVALFLGLGAERQDRHRDRPERGTGREDQPRVGTAVAQALDGRDGRQQVFALAAVFGRHGQAQDAEARRSAA